MTFRNANYARLCANTFVRMLRVLRRRTACRWHAGRKNFYWSEKMLVVCIIFVCNVCWDIFESLAAFPYGKWLYIIRSMYASRSNIFRTSLNFDDRIWKGWIIYLVNFIIFIRKLYNYDCNTIFILFNET